jgi:LysM repeat protein
MESIEEHYAKVYSDLPEEVVKMLINTHPLYEKDKELIKDKELTKDKLTKDSLKPEDASSKSKVEQDKDIEDERYEEDEEEEEDDDEDDEDDIEDEEKEFLSSLFSKQDKKHGKGTLRKYLAAAVVLTLVLVIGIFAFGKIIKNNNKIAQLQSDNFILEGRIDTLEVEKQQILENYSDLASELESQKQSSEPTSNQTPTKNNAASQTAIKETTKVVASTTQTPKTYTVAAGDSFWKISKKLYGSGNYYLDIMKENNIKKEADIFEGMTLKLPDIKGGK